MAEPKVETGARAMAEINPGSAAEPMHDPDPFIDGADSEKPKRSGWWSDEG